MNKYDLRNITKVEIYRNHLGQLFVDTPPEEVGGTNKWLRLEIQSGDGSRAPVYLFAEPGVEVAAVKLPTQGEQE